MAKSAIDKIEVLSVVGFAGDRTDVAMQAVGPLSDELSLHLDAPYVELEKSMTAGIASGWQDALAEGKYTFEMARDGLDEILSRGKVPILVTARCALSIATLPVVLNHYSDVVVVWFDAHGDLNTPETSSTGYLGGMPLAAALGCWDSGYGNGLSPDNLVLAGVRNLDDSESAYVAQHNVPCYTPGDGSGKWKNMLEFIAGRPVYVHLDVDAFDPEELPAEYAEQGGLAKSEVLEMLTHLSDVSTVVGVEIAEFEPKSTFELVKGAISLVECMRAIFPE